MFSNQYYLPHPALAPYVRCYWDLRLELPPGITQQVPFGCTGRTHWIIFLENRFETTLDTGGTLTNYDSMLVGQMMRPFTHHVMATTHVLTIDFTAMGFHRLWSVPAHALFEGTFETDAVLSMDTRSLVDQLRNAPSAAARVTALDAFFLRQLHRYIPSDPRIEAALGLIQQRPGHLQIRQLAQVLNCPERTLNRRFTEAVGLSPKYYARIQRFLQTRHWLEQQPAHHWPDLLTALGYYDQAHLINEFRYFTGKPPLVYGTDQLLDFMRES